MSIGNRIRSLRRSRHLTQQELGERIGRTQQEIYRWEKGLVRVHADDIAKMAEALHVCANVFFDELDNAVGQVDWEWQAAGSHMPADDRKQLIVYLNTVYAKKGRPRRKASGGPPREEPSNPPAPA
jgi:transcriptional regulator with XRE-family HTH domain